MIVINYNTMENEIRGDVNGKCEIRKESKRNKNDLVVMKMAISLWKTCEE